MYDSKNHTIHESVIKYYSQLANMDPVLGFIPANYFKLADRPHQGGIGGAFFMYNDTKNLLTKILDVRSNNILITIYFT